MQHEDFKFLIIKSKITQNQFRPTFIYLEIFFYFYFK